MAKQKRLPDLADDQRCTRNGRNWRCRLPRLPNKSYCHKHHLFNLSRSKSNSRVLQALNPANASSSREIWAFYNKSNGHPNFYARVDNIQSKKSSVEVTPLIPLNPSDTDTDVGCGLFRVSDCGATMEMDEVSHRAWFDMEADYLYKIFPRKGEVWAVDVYDWVEIVSSFDDEEGASGLVLVAEEGQHGFQRKLHDGCELTRRFRMDEVGMFRYRVSGARDACNMSNGEVGFSKMGEGGEEPTAWQIYCKTHKVESAGEESTNSVWINHASEQFAKMVRNRASPSSVNQGNDNDNESWKTRFEKLEKDFQLIQNFMRQQHPQQMPPPE